MTRSYRDWTLCTGDKYRENERRALQDAEAGIAGFWRDCQWHREPVEAEPVVVPDIVGPPVADPPVEAVARIVAPPEVPELGEEPDIQLVAPSPEAVISDAQVLAGMFIN